MTPRVLAALLGAALAIATWIANLPDGSAPEGREP